MRHHIKSNSTNYSLNGINECKGPIAEGKGLYLKNTEMMELESIFTDKYTYVNTISALGQKVDMIVTLTNAVARTSIFK